ncbi:MAG TPA: PEP-CTERM sorting domain-containing protein [Burkholderiales bacterium]|jgi:hypothetical protein|nr:PEP-CTERM sorting domain-containing protein [Burkholderiales bacterium]
MKRCATVRPSRHILQSLSFVLLSTLSAIAAQAAPRYNIMVLPQAPPQYFQAVGSGLNNHGDVVGSMSYSGNDGNTYSDAFMWQQGTNHLRIVTQEFGNPFPQDINDHRTVVTNTRIWQPGSGSQPIPVVPGSTLSVGTAVNNAGQVTGVSVGTTGSFLWDPATGIRALPVPAGMDHFSAWAINNHAEVVGAAQLDGWQEGGSFYWSEASGTRLVKDIDFTAINDLGQVVGNANGQAYLWTFADGAQPLGLLPGDPYAAAVDINNAGYVVGNGFSSGFLWSEAEGMMDLRELVVDSDPLKADVFFSSIIEINDHNEILGDGYVGWNRYTFLLTPVPEPEVYAMMLAGLAAATWIAHRRRRDRS